MKIHVLGCGSSSGVPMVGGKDGHGEWGYCDPFESKNKRSRSSVFLDFGDHEKVLIDTGPDLRQQLMRCGITGFEHIIFTHPHADHIAGIDDVRSINRLIKKPVKAYGTEATLHNIEKRCPYIFAPWEPPHFFRAVIISHPKSYLKPFKIGKHEFCFFRQIHGYTESTGIRVGDFAYCTDVVDFPEASWECLKGVQYWMVDCLQREPHFAHASLDKILKWRELLKPKKTILTHMGADMDWAWMKKHLPSDIEPAWDGMEITI